MAPLTSVMLSSLQQVIKKIPDQLNAFRSQLPNQTTERSKELKLFRALLAKLAGNDKNHQTAFLVSQAHKICRTTYVQVALESIPAPPNYATLPKKNRGTYAHVHGLIDKVLPIAAGSTSLNSQRLVFKNRWKLLHKDQSITTLDFEELESEMRALNSADL